MAKDTAIIDMDNPKQRQILMGWIKSLRGPHRVKITEARSARSLHQNAYYWGVVIQYVRDGLEAVWGESMEPEEVHEWLKVKFLPLEPVIDRRTGELKGRRIGSSARCDTKEFADYLNRIIAFARDELGVEIPPAEK